MHSVVLIVVGVLVLGMFALPLARSAVNLGSVLGIAIGLVLLLYGIFFRAVNSGIAHIWQGMAGRVVLCIVGAVVVAAIAVGAVAGVHIAGALAKAPAENATVVALGCKVRGTVPSLSLYHRIEAAADYLEEHPDAVCILAGGQGDAEDISEAECMYRYLVDMGIDPDRLIKEDESTTTVENIANAKAIIEERGLSRDLALVTNGYHQYRAQLIAREQGLEAGAVCAKTAWWLVPTYVLREICAIAHEWLP
ncbi:MAG: YdcF family protein [Coriobacteriales bacterium]